MKYFLFFFSIISFSQPQKFIPLDNETMEFVEEVNYTLYYKGKPIYKNYTSKDTITLLPNNIVFDSISFHKLNYKEIGFKKEHLKNVVFITKTIYQLNEIVVLNPKNSEIIIGEKSRFIKRRSRNFSDTINYGIVFREDELKETLIKKIVFFVEKVKHKTTYKIKFYSVTEIQNLIGKQSLSLNEIVFESQILTLEKGTKNKIEINLENQKLEFANKNILVTVELQEYYDDNNRKIEPESDNKTKLKFQLSKKLNYYAKTVDKYSKKLSTDLINENSVIIYDFAFKFFKKPHKSNLVSPAILLVVKPI